MRFSNLEGISQRMSSTKNTKTSRKHNHELRAGYDCKASDVDLAVKRKIDVILGARVWVMLPWYTMHVSIKKSPKYARLHEFCWSALFRGGFTQSEFNLYALSGDWLFTNHHLYVPYPNAYVTYRHLAQTPTVEADSKEKALLPTLMNHGPKVNERIFFFI